MVALRERIARSLTPIPGIDPVAYQYEQADRVIAALGIDPQDLIYAVEALRELRDADLSTARDYAYGTFGESLKAEAENEVDAARLTNRVIVHLQSLAKELS